MSVLPVTALDDYVTFCVGVRRLCGIDLSQYKRNQMERRIRSFAMRRGTPHLAEYLRLLTHDTAELEHFIDRVTINVSQLWRNPKQWEQLANMILPELAGTGRIRAWSAGSSYGAEAYTLAAVCLQAVAGTDVAIRGTDIDRRMVALARTGEFSDDDARDAPPDALERWFERSASGWRAGEELRAVTSFEVGDLLTITPRRHAYDLILCRNTAIYFTEAVRDALHARLADALRPGGFLVVGATERVASPASLGLASEFPFNYRKS
jgi:chemotaxis protein methyltransferase CheR